MNDLTPDSTLREAQLWLNERMDEGAECPCCTQLAKRYKRALPSASARVMIALHRCTVPGEFLFLPELLDEMKGTPHQGGYGTFSHHWGLIEQKDEYRDDGSNRNGWWRLTPGGRKFVLEYLTVPKYAWIFDNHCLKLGGEMIDIRDALGNHFDYDELMSG